jgi:hypothetical protein
MPVLEKLYNFTVKDNDSLATCLVEQFRDDIKARGKWTLGTITISGNNDEISCE